MWLVVAGRDIRRRSTIDAPDRVSTGSAVGFHCPSRADTVRAMGLRGGSRATGIALTVAVLTGASACGDSTPQSDPTSSVTTSRATSAPTTPTSPTAMSPPAEPILPPAARHRSSSGAKAFARYFVSLLWYASVSGHAGTLRKTSTDRCETCRSFARIVDRTYGLGGWVRSTRYATEGAVTTPKGAHAAEVMLRVTFPKEVRKPSAKATVVVIKRRSERLTFGMIWKGGKWIVDFLGSR
jgi:hypothetical protein